MFPRGPRFDPLKVPEGPAPNAYNPQESQFDAYKRGAFLEKADRFTKTEFDVPGPGVSNSDVKEFSSIKFVSKTQTQNSMRERYNTLQKKLEDLERIHQEGKKLHQSEVEKLAADILRSQRTATEQAERIEKQRKQSDILESRVQELRKAAQLDQAEIKGLKTKLKMAEHEKSQLSGKQTDVLEMKKIVQTMEANHRDELRARDKHITQLEKSLESETKRRELLEVRLQEFKSNGDKDNRAIQTIAKETESQLIATINQLSGVQNQLHDVQNSFALEREEFISRLTHYGYLLGQAAKGYCQLYSNTVSSSKYRKLKTLHHMAEMKIFRLERKLGNAEGQATELASLIRQVNDQNAILLEQLKDSIYQIEIYENLNNGSEAPHEGCNELECELRTILDRESGFEQERVDEEKYLQTLLAQYYDLRAHQIIFAFTCVDKEFTHSHKLAQQRSRDLESALASHEAIASSLESAQKERSRVDDELHALRSSHTTIQGLCISLEEEISTLKEQHKQAALSHEVILKKEKTLVKRLNESIQKCRAAEDSLRSEIDRLLTELADAERYQEAYNSLSEEIGLLVARKQLAEEEADRLGKFNAEILGHNNPAQRIAYVDRIRRDLAEAKHKIVMLSRDQETVVGMNADLQHELDMYKSVVSVEKPRTQVTRVQRVPLSNVTRKLNAAAGLDIDISNGVSQHQFKSSITHRPHLDPISDMRLDDLE